MTQHGGARKGAGRKSGSATQRTREVAERASADGIVPIEVMLTIMREQWAVYEKDRTPQNGAIALAAAKDVAPYVHPRLTATDAPIRLAGPEAAARPSRVNVSWMPLRSGKSPLIRRPERCRP